ncbi:hypothetical protein Tco_1493386 [Tanacetum coccineum]
MHQFWHNITKIKNSSSYKFKLDKKKCSIEVEVFRDILQICPRLPNQEFVVPPFSNPKIVSFIKELGYTGDIDSITKVYTDPIHQPWRTFATVINRCLFGKTTDMTNLKMQKSPAYKAYLAYATGGFPPNKSRKFKKPASLSKKKNLVAVEKTAKKPAKKPDARRQSAGVQIRDTLGGSSEGAGLELEVPDEQKGKSTNTRDSDDDDDQQGDDENTESDNDKDTNLNKTDDEEEDEFIHTLDDYIPTNDENIDDEEYNRINKEMYSDVNVELKETELEGKGKDDKEMTDVGHVYDEQEKVIQEVAGDQVKDVDQETVTAAPATQKTKVPLPSYTISSDYATKFHNFDNIPLGSNNNHSSIYSTIHHSFSTTVVPDSETLFAIHLRVSDLEKEVKELKNVDHIVSNYMLQSNLKLLLL